MINKIFLIFILCFTFITSNSFAATAKPDVYKVTMEKVELCIDADCAAAPYVIGSGEKTVDIASVTAGADAATFASTSGLPLGETFTHIRVTVNRSFTLKGTITDGEDTCTTDGSTEANKTTLHTATKNDTSGNTETTMWLVNAGSGYGNGNISMSYDSPKYALKITLISATSFNIIYALAESYTVGLIAPRIKVAFEMNAAIGGNVDTNCYMWPEEPKVTISISE